MIEGYTATIRPDPSAIARRLRADGAIRRPAAPSFEGVVPAENAVDKISELERQCLGRIHFGQPHAAQPRRPLITRRHWRLSRRG